MIHAELSSPKVVPPHPLDLAPFAEFPKRQWVAPEQRPWHVEHAGYKPPEYTNPKVLVLMAGDASLDWHTMPDDEQEKLAAAGYLMSDKGPRNPLGRTGLEGAGKWRRPGPNFATDLQLIAERRGEYFALTVVRKDNKDMIAWPGGMIDLEDLPGLKQYSDLYIPELRRQAAINAGIREVGEETTVKKGLLADILPEVQIVYSGPTGGPRGVDGRWAETVASTALISVDRLPAVKAGSDAHHALWTPISQELYATDHDRLMHACHGQTLQVAIGALGIQDKIPEQWDRSQRKYLRRRLSPEAAVYFRGVLFGKSIREEKE